MNKILAEQEIKALDGYFRACNYLSVAQIYLKDNVLLKRPLQFSDVKNKLVGHFGSGPGQNFVYTHLNRIITKYDLNMIYMSGPGHAGQVLTTNTYLEGSYTTLYPEITQNEEGLRRLCKSFSAPGGIGSHATPETPGSIHEGGELGYSLSHAFGAVFDNPDLIVACVVGDGEAETGPLAGSWHGNKFVNPKTDGVVIPILHLNGFKIANPTILARISEEELDLYFKGLGYQPYYVSGDDPMVLHESMASVMDQIMLDIHNIWNRARNLGDLTRPIWPMLILRTPKGWTGPKEIDGKIIENSFRSHQVPVEVTSDHPESLKRLETWLRSYESDELFSDDGSLKEEYKMFIPPLNKTMGLNPHANGGLLKEPIKLPNIDDYAIAIGNPGSTLKQDMREVGAFIRDVVKMNPTNFRIFGPDEVLSNRLNHVFEVTNRQWMETTVESDEFLAPSGRVLDSVLSEHLCQGWLEGYNLTGRYGFMHSYEAFIRIVDSMASQHAKWIKMASEIPWRVSIPSLNYILTSHAWQQDHNGYTHQDPGFLNHIMTKKASIVRAYLPFDANTLISTMNHVLATENYINVVIASKHPRLQWLTMEQAKQHCTNGIGIFGFASNDTDDNPDLVLACAGDTPTLEILAATRILNKFVPSLKIRVINVVDLMKLQPEDVHPHGLSDEVYDYLFTKDKPIVFAFHGYPNLIHELTYKRTNQNLHVRGYIEEGTITTPFDMRVLNKMDRYNLVMLAMKHIDIKEKETIINYCEAMLVKHKAYIKEHGNDLDKIENWTFEGGENIAD